VSWVGDQLSLGDLCLLWTSGEICSKVGSFVSAMDEQNQAGAEMRGQAGRQAMILQEERLLATARHLRTDLALM
jgi:hypothetical protein